MNQYEVLLLNANSDVIDTLSVNAGSLTHVAFSLINGGYLNAPEISSFTVTFIL